jgi:TLD
MIFFCPESSQKRSDAQENKAQLHWHAGQRPQPQIRLANNEAMGAERQRPAPLEEATDQETPIITSLNSYNCISKPPHKESLIGDSRNRLTMDSADAATCYGVTKRHEAPPSDEALKVNSRSQLLRLVGDMGMALFAPLDVEGLAPTTSFNDSEWRDGSNPGFQQQATPPTSFIARKRSDHLKIPRKSLQEDRRRMLTSSEGSLTTATAGETDCDDDDDEEDDFVGCWIVPVPIVACPRSLTPHMLQQLSVHFPLSCQGHMLERCFCIGEHGDSILSMLYQCRMFRYTVMVIQTTDGDVLGGFATANWNDKRHNVYYGDGQSFLFSSCPVVSLEASDLGVCPLPNPTLSIFPWSGDNDYCQICDPDQNRIAMGGEGDFGLIVRDNFSFGETGCSRTYRNPPLVPAGRFEIAAFEVYGIVPFSLSPQRFSSATP